MGTRQSDLATPFSSPRDATRGRGLKQKLAELSRITGVSRRTALPYAALTGVHLAAQLGQALGVPGASVVAPVTKALLLPALGAVAAEGMLSARKRTGSLPTWWPLAATGITFSWFGDLALINPDWFLAGVGLFGVAQVAYTATFVKAGDSERVAGRPGLLAPYAAWWAILLGFFAATEGITPMTGAVAVYGVALATMAHSAHRISTATAAGAAIFVASDSLIGLGGGGLELPAHGFWVMATYLLAQWLIVRGLVEAAHANGLQEGTEPPGLDARRAPENR